MNLYWDYENQKLYDGLNSGQEIQLLTMTFRDQVDVTLYVMKLNSATNLNELCDCPAGKSPLFGLKGTSHADLSGDYLAAQSTWTKSATGTYAATIDLATTELDTKMEDETSVTLKAEFTMRDVDEKDHYSTRFTVTMEFDVNGAGEAATHSVYTSTSSIVREEIISGKKYLVFYNSDGVEYLRIGPPGA